MIAKRIEVGQPKPPDRIVLEMSLEEAETLRGISYFTIDIPETLERRVPASRGEVGAALGNLYHALGCVGVRAAWRP